MPIIRWPRSLPDYKWPDRLLSAGVTPLRWLLAGVFHISHLAGRAASLFDRRRVTRVLLIRTDGVGDALLFEPALECLGRVLSPQSIHLWAPRVTCDLMRHCPTLRRLMTVPRGFKSGNLGYFRSPYWRAKLGFALGFWKFDKIIYPVESPEPLGNWLFCSARGAERWLNYGDTINQFDWQRSRTHERASWIFENRPGNAHELQRNEYLASQWSDTRELRKPKVFLTEDHLALGEWQVDVWRSAARKVGGTEVIGVVPAGSMSLNAYPNPRWAIALKRLWNEQNMMPVLLGGPAELPVLEALATELVTSGVPHLRMRRPLGILEMAAVLGKLDGLLSVDTGLAHLAIAQQTPTVVLSGGGNPGRFFPWPRTDHHTVLTVSMPCAGCNNRCTLAEPECITRIAPDSIVAAYLSLKGRRIQLDLYVASSRHTSTPLQAAG